MKSKKILSTKLSVITIKGSTFGLQVLNFLKNNNIRLHSLIVIKPSWSYQYHQFISVIRRLGILDTLKLTFERIYYFNINSRKIKKWQNIEIVKDYSKLCNKVHQTTDINSKECINALNDLKPNVLVLAQCGILKEEMLSIPDVILNAHPGILPDYRGVDVIEWALLKNDFENLGFTVHIVDKGVDTGGIVLTKKYNFKGDEDLKILNHRISTHSIILLILVVKIVLREKKINYNPQKREGKQYYKISSLQTKKAESNLSNYLNYIEK